jgi:hypothetical protein
MLPMTAMLTGLDPGRVEEPLSSHAALRSTSGGWTAESGLSRLIHRLETKSV